MGILLEHTITIITKLGLWTKNGTTIRKLMDFGRIPNIKLLSELITVLGWGLNLHPLLFTRLKEVSTSTNNLRSTHFQLFYYRSTRCMLLVLFHIFFTAPEAPPTKLKCEALSPKSLQIQWEPPPAHLSSGQVQGYKVFYQPIADEKIGTILSVFSASFTKIRGITSLSRTT